MLFSSSVFIYLFLPVTLALHTVLRNESRNVFLLIASLFFYAWGEYTLVLLMLASICFNYIIGLAIHHSHQENKNIQSRGYLILGIVFNLLVLIYYKYINFFVDSLNFATGLQITIGNIALPIGISFFTFQNISYIVDVHRRNVDGQKNLIHLGLYISLFPQLIAGPIVRYIDIYKEIKSRSVTLTLFSEGITRFIRGLAKKVLIANNVGLIADMTFEIAPDGLSTLTAWTGIICYTLQIYFDFSGYSDMAIGLGKMFGFNIRENFNYPYISRSIKEFWRRWHISLSTWFRDYLYIPLGGNRKGNIRTYVNLITVFFVTGLWHGASWNFVFWGLYHGTFLMIERQFKPDLPAFLNFTKRIYVLLVVMIGWVFFRSESFEYSILFIQKLFSFQSGTIHSPLILFNIYFAIIIATGIIFSAPVRVKLQVIITRIFSSHKLFQSARYLFYLCLFLVTIAELAQSTYNPFIYFRF